LKIRVRKETRSRRQSYGSLRIATESTASTSGEASSPGALTSPSSSESISSGTDQYSSTSTCPSVSETENKPITTEESWKSQAIHYKQQLTEQEQFAQSGLMLLASLPFLQSNSEMKPEMALSSLAITASSHHHSALSSFVDILGRDSISMEDFCAYQRHVFSPNSAAVTSALLARKNLMT
jgi:N-acyl-D-aspartate/D-glutamate deacylase